MKVNKITLEQNQLYVEQHIPSAKKFRNTLVFVHGSFGGYWMWNTIIASLVEQGFECVAFSLRGHMPSGNVDLTEVHMSDYANDVKIVVNELGIDEPVLIGHSMSGLVVLMAAMEIIVHAVIAIDPSQSLEVQGEGSEDDISKIPPVYNAMEAGMPVEPTDVAVALPDVSKEMLMNMKDMLGLESGSARVDRKRGISVPKGSSMAKILFIGAELGDSVPFGIPFEKTEAMAKYYESELIQIKGATHPGILVGEHAPEVATAISNWLRPL